MTRILVIALALLALAGGYMFYVSSHTLRGQTEKALEAMDAVVVTHDRAKIGEALKNFLTEDAKIHLEVSFFSIAQGDSKPAIQDFDTPESFITFIDNVLYTLTDYSNTTTLKSFTLSPDRKSSDIAFDVRQFADGTSLYGGNSVEVRFSSETGCTGQVAFKTPRPQLSALSCQLKMRMVPKPGETAKFRSLEMMQDLIK